MNSPLILFENKLPRELLDIIQSYLINDIAYIMLKEYFSYLYDKKELYEEFVYNNYVMPNCSCIRYFNSFANRWKTKECDVCFIYESTLTYMPEDFRLCIWDNDQFQKINYGEKIDESIYEKENEDEYEYEYIDPRDD